MPQKGNVGITHFPLASEQRRQEKVRIGKAEAAKTNTRTAGGSGKSGHRLSREQGAESKVDSESSFRGKGGKGGKSRGSRASLLASSRKVRNKSARARNR